MAEPTDETTEQQGMPDFPRLGEKTHVKLRKDWSARAWAGQPERLVQIQNEVEAALERAYREAIKDLPETDAGREEAEYVGQQLQLKVRATGNSGRLSRSGALSSIFAETDLGDIENLALSNEPTGPAYVEATFKRSPKDGSMAVHLQVSGSDRPWVGGTSELLASEIAKGVPQWAFLRHGGIAALLGAFLGWGVGGLLMATVADHPEDWVLGVLLVGALCAVVVGIPLWQLMMKVVPGFDIVEPGSSPAGRRNLAAAVTVVSIGLSVAGVVLGVLAL